MTAEKIMEVVTQAIEKAQKNGFLIWWWEYGTGRGFTYDTLSQAYGVTLQYNKSTAIVDFNQIIYNKEFLKAFYGEDKDPSTMWCDQCSGALGGWQYHAQQQVISEDPIKYIEDHLE